MQRKVPIKDKALKKLVDKKYEILKEGKANAKKAQKLQERNQELEKKLNPLKNKLVDKMKKTEKQLDLGDYEILLTTEIDKDGNYNLVIQDKMEEFKESFKKENYE